MVRNFTAVIVSQRAWLVVRAGLPHRAEQQHVGAERDEAGSQDYGEYGQADRDGGKDRAHAAFLRVVR